MRNRLNKKRIYFNRSKEVSKTEADRFMGNRLSDEQLEKIKILQKQWSIENSWRCNNCGKLNDHFDLNCKCCDGRKPNHLSKK